MKVDLVASLKEFFFDIIGFIIPGIVVLMIAKHVFNCPLELDYGTFATIILAYVIGYVVFSFSLIKAWVYDETFFAHQNLLKRNYQRGMCLRLLLLK